MKNQKSLVYKDNDFENYKLENVGVIKIKSNVFEIVTDLPESSKFIQAMHILEKDPNIDVMLILNEGNCLGSDEYTSYLKTIFSSDEREQKKSYLELTNNETRTRQLVILNSIIRKIINSNKLVVNAMQGEIVTPFFGASLASDIRLASENVCFLLSHIKMNIHPSGALPYFLPKYIGQAKSAQILFCKDLLSVQEAFELGLIYEILPVQNFEEQCIEKVKRIVVRGNNAIKCTKKLLNSSIDDLDKYLNMEECEYKY